LSTIVPRRPAGRSAAGARCSAPLLVQRVGPTISAHRLPFVHAVCRLRRELYPRYGMSLATPPRRPT
jgi:hypothetical protein